MCERKILNIFNLAYCVQSWCDEHIQCALDISRSLISPIQYIPRNMHTVFALLCFVVVIHWLIFPYPSGLLHWHCDNLAIAPVPAKQPWWIWINTSCEFIMNDCITTTKQITTKPGAYFLGYTVACPLGWGMSVFREFQTWSKFNYEVVVFCAISFYILPRYIESL